MSRKHLLLIALLTVAAAGAWLSGRLGASAPARAAEIQLPPGSAAVEIAGLKDILEKGLLATREEQKEFIAEVVQKVENNILPYRLVYISFRYARNKRPSFPFPYFKLCLQRLAAEEGIEI